jgi:hypothetical protein
VVARGRTRCSILNSHRNTREIRSAPPRPALQHREEECWLQRELIRSSIGWNRKSGGGQNRPLFGKSPRPSSAARPTMNGVIAFQHGLARRTGAGHTGRMAYEYRVTEAEDGTFPVELWSSKGGREQLVYKTRGFQTRQLAEAWIVPVEVQSGDPPQPRARVTYLKPRRSRVVIVSKPDPHPHPLES